MRHPGNARDFLHDQDRDDPAEHQAMQLAAPEAFAFFFGLPPGRRVDGGSDVSDAP
ncbi:hypothetical protein [Streptacidiphilus sp. MAP5-3]|uniref:hypothetical protein n=1 Tax=unclassified Streptacidiphilus TaxID=2643834 RepID=UPI003518E756